MRNPTIFANSCTGEGGLSFAQRSLRHRMSTDVPKYAFFHVLFPAGTTIRNGNFASHTSGPVFGCEGKRLMSPPIARDINTPSTSRRPDIRFVIGHVRPSSQHREQDDQSATWRAIARHTTGLCLNAALPLKRETAVRQFRTRA